MERHAPKNSGRRRHRPIFAIVPLVTFMVAFGKPGNALGQDLVVTAVSGPSAAAAGASASISITVRNAGSVATKPNTYIYVAALLSTNQTITLSDTELRRVTTVTGLGPGAQDIQTINITIPQNVTAGTYYWGGYVDPSNYIPETNDANNGLAGPSVQISATPRPDLFPALWSHQQQANSPGSIDYVLDIFDRTTPAYASPVDSRVYLSTDLNLSRTGDDYLGRITPGAARCPLGRPVNCPSQVAERRDSIIRSRASTTPTRSQKPTTPTQTIARPGQSLLPPAIRISE